MATQCLSVIQPLGTLATDDNTKDLSPALKQVFLEKIHHAHIITVSDEDTLFTGSMKGKYQTHVQLSG